MSDPTKVEERGWWEAFKQGDQQALHELYTRYFDRLYSYGYRLCNQRDLLEDIVQEFFLKLMRTRQNLATPDSVQAYMFHGFRMLLIDKLAQQNRRLSKENAEWIPFDMGEMHDRMADKELDRERTAKLKKALDQLTDRQREAIFLRYFEELPYPEIANMLQLSQKAAYKLIGRAMAVLKDSATMLVMIFLPILLFIIQKAVG
ncbi:MAG TPA: RNA polymerase sigma factor [Phnomibacter sp.]|nr:RNA polymerase sigma factor [Phnomibacter sp.]